MFEAEATSAATDESPASDTEVEMDGLDTIFNEAHVDNLQYKKKLSELVSMFTKYKCEARKKIAKAESEADKMKAELLEQADVIKAQEKTIKDLQVNIHMKERFINEGKALLEKELLEDPICIETGAISALTMMASPSKKRKSTDF